MRPPITLLREENGEALINLLKVENDGIDALKVRSIKICKSLLECPTITALAATFAAKAFNDTDLLKSYLAGGNKNYNFCRQSNRKPHD